jgi:hypothetical protein
MILYLVWQPAYSSFVFRRHRFHDMERVAGKQAEYVQA